MFLKQEKKPTDALHKHDSHDSEMSDQPSELEFLKSAICLKDGEIFTLRGELDRRIHENQMLMVAIERLERTMSASHDRLIRKLDRCCGFDCKRRKR